MYKERINVGAIIYSDKITVKHESAGFVTAELNDGYKAVSVLLHIEDTKNKFNDKVEETSLRTLGLIGFKDLQRYLPTEMCVEIELAEYERLNSKKISKKQQKEIHNETSKNN